MHMFENIFIWTKPYLQDLFITIIGSFLGFFFALIIFRKQARLAAKKKERETMQDFISRLKYLNISIDNTIKNSKRQIANYSDLAKRMKESPYEIHLVKLLAFNDFRRISQMDSQEIFKAYMHLFGENYTNIKQYHKIYRSLDFIETALNQQISSLEKNHQFIHGDQKRVKDLIDGLSDDIASVLFQLDRKYSDSDKEFSMEPAVEVLEDYLNKYMDLVKRKAFIYDYELEFSKPFRETMIKSFRALSFTDYLVDKSRKAAVLLEHIKFNSLAFAKQVEEINHNIKKMVDELYNLNSEIDCQIEKFSAKAK